MSVSDEKSQLRRELKLLRLQTSESERRTASVALCQNLWAFLQEQHVDRLGVYLATPSEISLDPLIEILLEKGVVVAAPRVNLTSNTMSFFRLNSFAEVQIGPWNLREPAASSAEIHPRCVLVPGVAFDEHGHRLGMGAGWYDRTLTPQIKKVGVAYDFQIISRVPVENHDLPMNWVFTEQRMLGPF